MSEFKHRTTEAARDALSRFCTRKAPVMTIPVDNERDADMILGDVIEERDFLLLQVNELQALLFAMFDKCGADLHEDGCPEDDTCGCVMAQRVNAAMKGYTEKPD